MENSVSGPPRPFSSRIPGLDGLRALAALAVYFEHAFASNTFHGPAWISTLFHPLGQLAVPLFFVLSGFLITHLLLDEEEQTGTISLKFFYLRRSLRILPAGFAYLLVVALLTPLFGLTVKLVELLAAATFWRNFLYHGWAAWAQHPSPGASYTAHFWSLSVEEHFYLMWPLALCLVPPRGRPRLIAGLLVLVPVWRAWWLKHDGIGGMNHWRTDLVLDYLMAGALLALLFHHSRGRAALRRLNQHRTFALGGVVAGLFLVVNLSRLAEITTSALEVMRVTLAAGSLALLVAVVAQGGTGPFQRVLDSAPAAFMGRISYSFYLWQQLFTVNGDFSGRFTAMPLSLLCSLAAATTSYYLIERPFLNLRHRFQTVSR